MPMYEYKCKSCNEVAEVYHSISVDSQDCLKCKSPMERLISRCTVHVDTIPKTYCSATGKHYESRSEMRDELKAIGAVAVDKDWSPKKKVKKEEEVQREIMDDLQAAARDIRYGNSNDLTEAEKAECRELDEKDGYKPIKF